MLLRPKKTIFFNFKGLIHLSIDYLRTQIGSPDGTDSPNKKHYDPRKWVREGEVTFNTRLEQAFADLNNVNTL